MIVVHDEVASALLEGRPVVALESAVITAGLPREPIALSSRLKIHGWRSDRPVNLELALAMERTVRAGGATPATIAVVDGRLHIGLSNTELEGLALDALAGKASITDLASTLTPSASQKPRGRINAGTTVSATLAACSLADPNRHAQASGRCPIAVFATGGIGGVHRGWTKQPDVSADLRAIAGTPVCVVCSGGKSILDLPATLETLEALNVPVLGHGTYLFPQFQSLGTTDLRVRLRVDDASEAAALCDTHWRTLLQSTGVLLANPVPAELAIDAMEMTLAVDLAEREAKKRGVIGAMRTPFLLGEIARLTNNKSLEANLALLVSNARLAAEVAVALGNGA